MFQSTPPHGGRLASFWRLCGGRCFNPRPRTGGDADMRNGRNPPMFQSTPPHGGRRARSSHCPDQVCFNPRPRTGGDEHSDGLQAGCRVSIHAPARGATSPGRKPKRRHRFQSTPPHGGRRRNRIRVCGFLCFNPRPRTGGDIRRRFCVRFEHVSIHAPARGATDLLQNRQRVSYVSIHAPARGATCLILAAMRGALFQSTPPHGGRPGESSAPWVYVKFQSTPPHGGRRGGLKVTLYKIGFNPRPRTGGDLIIWLWCSRF